MDIIIGPLLSIILILLNALFWVITLNVILSWLFAFGIINTYNPVVNQIADILFRITEPLLRPIRNRLPSLGGLDLSPFVLILTILFLERVIGMLMIKLTGF